MKRAPAIGSTVPRPLNARASRVLHAVAFPTGRFDFRHPAPGPGSRHSGASRIPGTSFIRYAGRRRQDGRPPAKPPEKNPCPLPAPALPARRSRPRRQTARHPGASRHPHRRHPPPGRTDPGRRPIRPPEFKKIAAIYDTRPLAPRTPVLLTSNTDAATRPAARGQLPRPPSATAPTRTRARRQNGHQLCLLQSEIDVVPSSGKPFRANQTGLQETA